MKKVLISMIDYNGKEKTLNCLSSLDKLNLKEIDLTVLIIDNYPKGEFSLGGKSFKQIKTVIIKPQENLGFAGGHNIGIEYAESISADYTIVLNNDTVVDPDLVLELIAASERHPQAGAVVPKIYFMKGYEYHKDRYKETEKGKVIWYAGGHMDWDNINGVHEGVDDVDKGQFDDERSTDLLTGCCVLFTREALKRVKGFDARYFLYYEDADLNERIKKAGFTILYAPKAVLWHLNAGSTGGSGSILQDYFISRNRLLFGLRFARTRTKVALLRESIRILRNGREWQKKGVRDYYLRKFYRGSFPL